MPLPTKLSIYRSTYLYRYLYPAKLPITTDKEKYSTLKQSLSRINLPIQLYRAQEGKLQPDVLYAHIYEGNQIDDKDNTYACH